MEDIALVENSVRYAKHVAATAAAVGEITVRLAAIEMAAAQPVGLELPPATPQAS